MKKSYIKVIWRTIMRSFSRFAAIFAIVAIGVGFLAGLLAATPDMRHTGDVYFDETNLYDVRIISTLGLTDKDVDYFNSLDGIDEVMPAQSADVFMDTSEHNTLTTKIHGINFENLNTGSPQNYINRVVLIEGTMPTAKNECLVEKEVHGESPVKIGDTLTISAENENAEDILSQEKFTVTGIVQSAYYFSYQREPSTIGSGTTNLVMYADMSAFSREAYSEIFITLDGAKSLNALEGKYTALRDEKIEFIENNSGEQLARRHSEIIETANKELSDAKKEYEDKKAEALQKLADAEKELTDGEQKLADGEKKLADGEIEYADGLKKLEDGKADLAKGEEEYIQGIIKYNNAAEQQEKQFNDSQAQIDSGKEGLLQLEGAKNAAYNAWQSDLTNPALQQQYLYLQQQYDTTKQQLDDSQQQLDQGRQAFQAFKSETETGIFKAENKLIDARAEIQKGEKELADAKATIESSKKDIEKAKAELEDGRKKYEDAKAEADEKLADAQEQIDDAEKEIADIEMTEWYVLGRDTNIGFSTFDSNISKVEAIAGIFPIFFFAVAALVALTTMTRMVEEERLQIGTIKALGYSRYTIASKYILYALIASILGCAVGLAIGFNLFPRVIWNAYGMMYNLPPLICQFNVKFAVLSSGAAIGCTMLATANAVWSTLSEHPATLMLPKAPKAGKRIFLERISFIWKHMKFTHKVTARNLFRYKKRFFMTVIGIAGCTSLLVAGFGLRDSVGDVIYKQFGTIFNYDFIVSVKTENSVNDAALNSALNNTENVSAWMLGSEEKITNVFNGEAMTTYIHVPESLEKFTQFFSLHQRKSGEAVPLTQQGVVITEKMSERSGVKAGDTITIQNADKKEGTFTVTGVAENYVENYMYMSAETYEAAFGEKPELTSVYGTLTDNKDAQSLTATALLSSEDVNTISFVSDIKNTFDDMIKNITYIVYVLIISSGALAFVVLYNLTNINITEREKEIATIKVLGFFDGEVSAYVYRENAVLSLIGVGAGLFCGVFLHAFIIRAAEVDAVMFGREVSFMSYVFSAAITLFFSVLVSIVMNFKLKKISMVESMKAPE